MGVDGGFAECKAYSPALCFGLRVGAHFEWGEDVVELAKRDADALVLDGEGDEIRLAGNYDQDLAFFTEINRVYHQIIDRLTDVVFIHWNHHVFLYFGDEL